MRQLETASALTQPASIIPGLKRRVSSKSRQNSAGKASKTGKTFPNAPGACSDVVVSVCQLKNVKLLGCGHTGRSRM